ncbi:MAG: carboxypeptidase regulatory-like domain-containing protein, partial [Candidatus Eremiobacterota bacterium]
QVSLPDGKPAAGITVRVIDWATTKTDAQGNYRFTGVTPGVHVVRAECPGADDDQDLTLAPGEKQELDINLEPEETVSARWTLQQREGDTSLTGGELLQEQATFKLEASRISLRHPMAEVESGSDLMLDEKDGQIVLWLFDGSGRNGLCKSTRSYDAVDRVDPASDFQMLRGLQVRPGDVYLVRTCNGERYAKLQFTAVTPAYSEE